MMTAEIEPTYSGHLIYELHPCRSSLVSPCCRAMDKFYIRQDRFNEDKNALKIEIDRTYWRKTWMASGNKEMYTDPHYQPVFRFGGRVAKCCPWCGAKPEFIGSFYKEDKVKLR